jgi:hypothetical protein
MNACGSLDVKLAPHRCLTIFFDRVGRNVKSDVGVVVEGLFVIILLTLQKYKILPQYPTYLIIKKEGTQLFAEFPPIFAVCNSLGHTSCPPVRLIKKHIFLE